MRRVLVVEHDSLHRELLREWLEEGGVQVLNAQSVGDAPVNIDALVVDVASQEQAHAVLRLWRRAYPRAAIVVASGGFDSGHSANDAMAAPLGVTAFSPSPLPAPPYGRP